jgi:putative nucleotidyltransferase with HDIG domain
VSRGKSVAYVGNDPGQLDRLAVVLEPTSLELASTVRAPLDAAGMSAPPAPVVAVLDASALDADSTIAGIAILDAAWNGTTVVVMHDDRDPAVVRALLDAGAASIVPTATSDSRLRAVLEAACEGQGFIDVDVVRPVIDLYATMHAESRRRNRAVIESLAAAVEAKDSVTSRHLRAVSRLATQLARQVDPSLGATDDFLFGCLLHDVGKIGVPERILMKPGALTDAEWQVMRRHPQTGAKVVRPLGLPEVVTDVVLHHHERWDGRGYPHGLRGDEIPLAARIFSVCDALEAMTATRPYRGPLPVSVAFERVRLESGAQFDPAVIDALAGGVESGEVDLDVASGDVDVGTSVRRPRIGAGLR